MNIEDKHIANIISKDSQENVTVPSWNSMSASVKKQNFFIFGLRHFNVLTLCILFFFIFISIFGYKYYREATNSSIIQTEIQTLKNPILSPESNSIIVDTARSLTNETLVSNKPKSVKQEVSIKTTTTSEVFIEIEQTEVNPIETGTQQINTNQPDLTSKPKGKTIIVYQTDTVIQYDTLKVDKKRRSQK